MTRLPDRPACRNASIPTPGGALVFWFGLGREPAGRPPPWPPPPWPPSPWPDRLEVTPQPHFIFASHFKAQKSFHDPSQGRRSCILATRHAAPSNAALNPRVSSGPPGIFPSVDLSSGAGHYLRKEMKGLLEYRMSMHCVCYSHAKCLLLVISLAPFSRQYQFNTSDSGP